METNLTLLEYMRCGELDDNLLFKKSAINQMIFVRDKLCHDLFKAPVFVVSTHTSKSCKLPVYGFVMPNGINVIMRDNFHGWVVSMWVDENKPKFSLERKILEENNVSDINPCYCEGFKEEWVFPYEIENTLGTTFRVFDNYDLYTLFYLLSKTYTNDKANIKHLTDNEITDICNQIKDRHQYLKHYNEIFPETISMLYNKDIIEKYNLPPYINSDDIPNIICKCEDIKICLENEVRKFLFFETYGN